MRDIYINSNLNPLAKFTSSIEFKDILPWNISQVITKTIQINSRIVMLYNEMGHPVMSLLESQRKLRQQHDQNLEGNGGKASTGQ